MRKPGLRTTSSPTTPWARSASPPTTSSSVTPWARSTVASWWKGRTGACATWRGETSPPTAPSWASSPTRPRSRWTAEGIFPCRGPTTGRSVERPRVGSRCLAAPPSTSMPDVSPRRASVTPKPCDGPARAASAGSGPRYDRHRHRAPAALTTAPTGCATRAR